MQEYLQLINYAIVIMFLMMIFGTYMSYHYDRVLYLPELSARERYYAHKNLLFWQMIVNVLKILVVGQLLFVALEVMKDGVGIG